MELFLGRVAEHLQEGAAGLRLLVLVESGVGALEKQVRLVRLRAAQAEGELIDPTVAVEAIRALDGSASSSVR